MKKITILLLVSSTLLLSQDRQFYMGFTPWPYEATVEAVDWVYSAINTDGDIICHHMDEGVPWPEAYDSSAFPQSYVDEINGRTARYQAGKKVLLSINPLNVARDNMARYRGSGGQQDLPAPWDGYTLDSPEVKTAYVNYARRMTDYFGPDYLCFGIEVNLLLSENKSLWPAYVDLHKHVYTELKKSHPSLPLTVSFVSPAFFPEWSPEHNLADQQAGLADIIDHVDFMSFSVHAFMSALLCDTFPDNYFDRLFAYTDKPVAITETSYPAQSWDMGNITFAGTEEKQDRFTQLLLEAAQREAAEFVIWFSVRDYDSLWTQTLGQDPIGLIWRDTGLYDEPGDPRQALTTWQSWYSKVYTPIKAQPRGIQVNSKKKAGITRAYDLQGRRISTEPTRPGIYLTQPLGENRPVKKLIILPK